MPNEGESVTIVLTCWQLLVVSSRPTQDEDEAPELVVPENAQP